MDTTTIQQTPVSTSEMATTVSCYWNLPVMEWVKIVILTLGFIGNGLAFLVIVLNKTLHSHSFAIIGAIALSDCIYCLGGVLWGFLVYGYMDPSNYRNLLNCLGDFFNIHVKTVMSGTMSAAYIASGFFIATLSVFRYIIVCCNARPNRILKKKSVVFIIISVAVSSIIFAVLKTMYSGRFNKVLDITISYLLPLVIMTVFLALKIIKMTKRRDLQLFNSTSIRNMEIVCLAIILTFFVLLLPWHVLALLYEFDVYQPEYIAVTTSAFLLQLNNCINPVFYAFLSPRVRKVMASCLCRVNQNTDTRKQLYCSTSSECSKL